MTTSKSQTSQPAQPLSLMHLNLTTTELNEAAGNASQARPQYRARLAKHPFKGHNAQAWVVEATTAFEAALKEIN